MLTARNRKFYLDDEEFIIHSGSLHYFRTLPEYWESLLTKFKAAGLNCVESYVCWNLHEPEHGKWDFSGNLDLVRFIQTAQMVGLKVILRPGPYICAEWDNGGLPAWLYREDGIRLRCNKEPYIGYLKAYLNKVLSLIKPYTHDNGGPIIAFAIENEYGSFGDDFEYLAEIEKVYTDSGIKCMFFASDGNTPYYFCTGSLPHVIKGQDFGYGNGAGKDRFKAVDAFYDGAPYFATEYWAGVFTWWMTPYCRRIDQEFTAKCFKDMVDIGASFNIYMFFGGTNFGFTSGANLVADDGATTANAETIGKFGKYFPDITSYDYDAAISEWGDYRDIYFAMRKLLADEHTPPVPPRPTLQSIGRIELTASAPLFDNLSIGKTFKSKTVESMEKFGQDFGYILYKKTLSYDSPYDCIKIIGLADRAHVYVNGELVGIRMRDHDDGSIILSSTLKKGDVIEILVENMGRVNYGTLMYFGDRKGITGGVILGKRNQMAKYSFDWEITTLSMDELTALKWNSGAKFSRPTFFKGSFKASSNDDCFVHLDNFSKGVVYINGFNLGRYWEKGPQEALYIPGSILKELNEIIVFETDGLKGEPVVEITDKHGLRYVEDEEHGDWSVV